MSKAAAKTGLPAVFTNGIEDDGSGAASRLHFADGLLPALSRIPHIHALLDDVGEARIGWGRKRSGRRAQRLAARKGIPFLLLEDGFLRSVEPGDPPLSLTIDDLGIYYDANEPSRLERLIAEPLTKHQTDRARVLIKQWREAGVSKYNHARDYEGALPDRYVLVCDQTRGDASIRYGRASEASFTHMLQAAARENPECQVLVKLHPDAFTRSKPGHFDPETLKAMPQATVLAEDCHPARLIEEAEAVYAVTSQMGFEALVRGKKVRSFGMPFYAGWGLTDDALSPPSRRGSASLEQLVHAALIRYPRYLDPETGARCEAERVLSHLALQRRMRSRFPARIYALGFSRWKRPILESFLAGSKIRFASGSRNVPEGGTVAIWGRQQPEGLPADAKLVRLEDGFLRSVGLGADFTRPLSWVRDDEGIYYDASGRSRLERLLAETRFDTAQLARAEKLRRRIVDAGLTKYNTAAGSPACPWRRPETDKRIILVPGQVENDASILFGAPAIKTNIGLLEAVRAANPDAHIVYKPHPDIVAGLRQGGTDEHEAGRICNEIVADAAIAAMLDQVDELHTLTSLAGFEALLRGLPVACYGQPFYAGWGLTADILPITRRQRRLGLDELVAGSLILYPAYISRVTGRFTTPERAVEELISWRETGGGTLPLWRRMMRPAFAFSGKLVRQRGFRVGNSALSTGMETRLGG